jgi:hypothetical protein
VSNVARDRRTPSVETREVGEAIDRLALLGIVVSQDEVGRVVTRGTSAAFGVAEAIATLEGREKAVAAALANAADGSTLADREREHEEARRRRAEVGRAAVAKRWGPKPAPKPRTKCARGHPYSWRMRRGKLGFVCKTCMRSNDAKSRARRIAKAALAGAGAA